MKVTNIEFVDRLLDYRKILYLCHKNADPDAVGSAYALSESFGGDIGLVEGSNRVADNIINRMGINVIEAPDPDDYDLIVVVDTSTHNQISNMPLHRYAMIDHHSTISLLDKADFYIHEIVTSNVELVFRLLNETGIPISQKVAIVMLTGIITDTGHFKHANSDTFETLSEIIRTTNIVYTDALDLMATTPQDISLKIAMLKAARRNRFRRISDTIISTTQVSSYGGSAAAMLTNIGADVALVGTIKENNLVRVNGRAKREIVQKGLNLGILMEQIGEKYGGSGGGHSGAAGVDSSACTLDVLMQECIEQISDVLLEKKTSNDPKQEKNEKEETE